MKNKYLKIPKSQWKDKSESMKDVYISEDYLIQVHLDYGKFTRILVCSVWYQIKNGVPIYKDKIPWDDLMDIKNCIGFKDNWFVECYPPVSEVVNVANFRHLFLLDSPPEFRFKN